MNKMKRWPIFLSLALFLSACPQFEEPDDRERPSSPAQNNAADTPDPDLRCPVELIFEEAQDAESVAVSGEFNEWSQDADPMERVSQGWRRKMELKPGQYGFKYIIDGHYEDDPPPFVYTKWVGETENRNLIVEDCQRPTLIVESLNVSESGQVLATLLFEAGVDGAQLDQESLTITLGEEPANYSVDGGRFQIDHQLSYFGKFSLRVRARDEAGRPIQRGPFWIPLWYEAEPFHFFDAVMYLIFTDRFRKGSDSASMPPVEGVAEAANYQGGNFQGITAAIREGYFDELGVNALWLNPINENTDRAHKGSFDDHLYTGYHGYWTIDPLQAEPRFGGDDALKELIQAAHARGIRVVFDLVLNHVHEDHLYCQTNPTWCAPTCVCGAEGCGWEEEPLICQFAPYLPDLNYRNHEILERVIDDVLALMAKFDVDALRIDAAKHMDHIIMRTLRLRLNELEAQGAAPFYLVGETFTGEEGHGEIMRYVADWELHGQFDFPLLYPIRRTFAEGGSFRDLEAAIVRSEHEYGDSYPWHSPFLGNHDIPRFVTAMVGDGQGPFGETPDLMAQGPSQGVTEQWIIDRLGMAYAFLLTIPGIPLLYYGDEIGLAGDADPDNRRMMIWERNANQAVLFQRVQALGRARQELEALRYGRRQELWLDDDFYVFMRDAGAGRRAIVAMNKSDDSRSEIVQLPADWPQELILRERLRGGELHATAAQVELSLPAWGVALFEVIED